MFEILLEQNSWVRQEIETMESGNLFCSGDYYLYTNHYKSLYFFGIRIFSTCGLIKKEFYCKENEI